MLSSFLALYEARDNDSVPEAILPPSDGEYRSMVRPWQLFWELNFKHSLPGEDSKVSRLDSDYGLIPWNFGPSWVAVISCAALTKLHKRGLVSRGSIISLTLSVLAERIIE